jgi:hypothetical protein
MIQFAAGVAYGNFFLVEDAPCIGRFLDKSGGLVPIKRGRFNNGEFRRRETFLPVSGEMPDRTFTREFRSAAICANEMFMDVGLN